MLISVIMARSNGTLMLLFLHLLCSYRLSFADCLGKKSVFLHISGTKKPKKAVFFSICVKKWKNNMPAYFGLPEEPPHTNMCIVTSQ